MCGETRIPRDMCAGNTLPGETYITVTADLRTNFGRNPMNIHGVMTDYLRKIRSKVCHAYRVNALEESVEN